MADKQTLTTREQVRAFNNAFERPVHESWTNMSVTDRILVGKLLFEEVLEYLEKGLGLRLAVSNDHEYDNDFIAGACQYQVPVLTYEDGSKMQSPFTLTHIEGDVVDPVEVVDGLADVNVVIHFNAHWHGFNLDRATTIVNDSNMSKLGQDGRPIINGVTPGYRDARIGDEADEPGFDPAKPLGKILKGPNSWEPASLLSALIAEAGNNAPNR